MSKPIVLYSHKSGPNPWKVSIVLEELGVPYETKFCDFPDLKKEPYLSINPNGRVPAIEDPNTGLKLWESGAIIEYLVEQYDTSNNLSYTSFPEKYHTRQWLAFQLSGQGPYFGQAVWFSRFHPEKLPSAIERYLNEIKRVTGVVDRALQGREYLVGDKCTYADLAFVTWFQMAALVFGENAPDYATEYPNYDRWFKKLLARPAVKKVLDEKRAVSGY